MISDNNTQFKIEAVVQKVRESVSLLCSDTLADCDELHELKKLLEECLEPIEQLQNEKLNIFIKDQQLLIDAKKAHKVDIKMLEECTEMLKKAYRENFDLKENISMYEIREQSYLERIQQLEEENQRLNDLNNQATLSENNQKPEHDKVPDIDMKETGDTVSETPDFNKKIILETYKNDEQPSPDSINRQTRSNKESSEDPTKTTSSIKPKRSGKKRKSKIDDASAKKFECSICGNGKSFLAKGDLKRHMRIHTGEKPYECHYCASKFNLQSILDKHIICIHTKQFPYSCQVCGKGFLFPLAIQKHIKHSGHIANKKSSKRSNANKHE